MPTKKRDTRHPRLSEGAMIGMFPTPSPQWWEMLDWDEMGDTWWEIKEEIRQKVRDSGKAPKFDRKPCPICGGYHFASKDIPTVGRVKR